MDATPKSKVVRLNQGTAQMLATLREMIESTYFPTGLRSSGDAQLTDGATIRVALEMAALAVAKLDPIATTILGEVPQPRARAEWQPPTGGDAD